MPEMDGLRSGPNGSLRSRKLPNIPIIARRHFASKGIASFGLEAGMDDYISKPNRPKKFADDLDRVDGEPTPGAPQGGGGKSLGTQELFRAIERISDG